MTIQEIAERAGVSIATVSRVFSHHPGIKPEVREHVFKIAREYGYHPRVSGKQKNVVIITPYDSIYPVQSCVDMLLMSLTRELPGRGFRIEILPVNNLERLNSIQFCAAVAIGTEPSDFTKWSDRFSVPLILVDRKCKRKMDNVFTVRSNEFECVDLAVSHFYRHGCRKLGCIIHGTPDAGNAGIRYEAWKDSLLKHDLPFEESMVFFSGPGNEKYVEYIGKLLRRGIDALFCPGGNAGIISLYAMSLYNKKIPDDVSLIASEQTFFSEYAVPPQTTVTQNYKTVAAAAADVIERWLDNDNPPCDTVIPYQLLDRESVKS